MIITNQTGSVKIGGGNEEGLEAIQAKIAQFESIIHAKKQLSNEQYLANQSKGKTLAPGKQQLFYDLTKSIILSKD